MDTAELDHHQDCSPSGEITSKMCHIQSPVEELGWPGRREECSWAGCGLWDMDTAVLDTGAPPAQFSLGGGEIISFLDERL